MSTTNAEWASPQAWEAHRSTISDLYENRNMKLQDIMKMMENNHNFFATPRMYKTRFKKWGLQKTLRFDQVCELLRQNTTRAAMGKDSVRLIRGRVVDDRRLRKYIQNLSPEKYAEMTSIVYGNSGNLKRVRPVDDIYCRTPSPEPQICRLSQSMSPGELRIPEECIYAMRHYGHGAIDTGIWNVNPREILRAGQLFNFWNLAAVSTKLLRTGQTKSAFRLLHKCFHEYKPLLAAQSPLLFLYTFVVALLFAHEHPDLYRSFLRYITELSRIVHEPSHPLGAIFDILLRMGPDAARESAAVLTSCYVELCQREEGSIAMIDSQVFMTFQFANIGMHGFDVAEEIIRDLLDRLEPYRGEQKVEAIYLDSRDDLAAMCSAQGKFQEARDILMESLKSPTLDDFPLLRASIYRHLFTLARDEGDHQQAMAAGHRVLRFCIDTWGLNDGRTLTVMGDVKSYLSKHGQVELAEHIGQDFDKALDELSKGIGEFDIQCS
ncbi:Clr5 domain-containing protein [Xylariales sp. PMI_506]|nr:Clr5 domain-containing protein [Xylariales sp. PMI_506]